MVSGEWVEGVSGSGSGSGPDSDSGSGSGVGYKCSRCGCGCKAGVLACMDQGTFRIFIFYHTISTTAGAAGVAFMYSMPANTRTATLRLIGSLKYGKAQSRYEWMNG